MSSSKIDKHLKIAKIFAGESHAKRLKVGAVLIRDDRIIATGYNGTPNGRHNNCEEYIQEGPISELVTKPEVIHAEANIVSFCASEGIKTKNTTLVCTHSPCFECAKLIIQAKIDKVYYKEPYRDS